MDKFVVVGDHKANIADVGRATGITSVVVIRRALIKYIEYSKTAKYYYYHTHNPIDPGEMNKNFHHFLMQEQSGENTIRIIIGAVLFLILIVPMFLIPFQCN